MNKDYINIQDYVSILQAQLNVLDMEYRHAVRLNNINNLTAIMIEVKIIKEQLAKIKDGL